MLLKKNTVYVQTNYKMIKLKIIFEAGFQPNAESI